MGDFSFLSWIMIFQKRESHVTSGTQKILTLVSSGPWKILTLATTPGTREGDGLLGVQGFSTIWANLASCSSPPCSGQVCYWAASLGASIVPACPFKSLCTNVNPRENRARSRQRLAALTPETQMSTEVTHVTLLAIRMAAIHGFCSTMPTAALLVCMTAKEYEQGRIKAEILFLSIWHCSWLRQTSPWHTNLLQFLQKNWNPHVFPDALVCSNKAIILLSTNLVSIIYGTST